MISERSKELFEKLNMPYPAVAIKYHVVRPQGIKQYEGEKRAFCEFLKLAQDSTESFYIEQKDDVCNGKMILGMIDKPPVTAYGAAGPDFEMYRQNGANRRIYQEMPVLEKGSCHYVQYAKVSDCDFHPDLVMCVCDNRTADIVLRATSYITGDFWESKSTPVISCAWMYTYPVISGKCNHILTGRYHGLKRRKLFPEGLTMIAIPFQKLDLVCTALDEMPWVAIAFREDEESKKELARRMAHWQEMAAETDSVVELK